MTEQGFANPVDDAQRIFRVLLTALSEPGRIVPAEPACVPPTGVDPAAAAIILALCDGDTPLWLSPGLEKMADFFRFHTGAPVVAHPGDALFALARGEERPQLDTLSPGLPDYPDRAATLVLAVDAIDEKDGWRLSGPGIEEQRMMIPRPLDVAFTREWQENHARFPLGVDVLFTARDRVAGLPRSTLLEG
jgi:alpha-D-ribose 1-methylphosphonate 5-triphosphate synthase subunit PhnH